MKKGLSFITAICISVGSCLWAYASEDNLSHLNADNIVLTESEEQYEDGCYYNYDTGKRYPLSFFYATRLMSCNSGDMISIENAADGHICFYDSEKNYLSGDLINQTWKGITYDNIITVPENCSYFRLSTRSANRDLINIHPLENSDSAINDHENTNIDELENSEGIEKSEDVENSEDSLTNAEKLGNNSMYTYIVAADGSGDFTTISDAVNRSASGDIIYIKSGTYKEEIDLGSKVIHLIGENRLTTIIYNTTGEYEHNPITMGAGILEELTVYAKNEDSHPVGHTAYAVHVERNSLYNNSLVIKDCILKSDFNAAFGMGMRGGCNVLLENVDFVNTANDRALYFHDAEDNTKTGIQRITVRDCRLKVEGNAYAILHLQSQEKPDSMVYITFQNNKLFSKSGSTDIKYTNWHYSNSTNSDDFGGLINWRLTDDSYGNSLDVLNY